MFISSSNYLVDIHKFELQNKFGLGINMWTICLTYPRNSKTEIGIEKRENYPFDVETRGQGA